MQRKLKKYSFYYKIVYNTYLSHKAGYYYINNDFALYYTTEVNNKKQLCTNKQPTYSAFHVNNIVIIGRQNTLSVKNIQ